MQDNRKVLTVQEFMRVYAMGLTRVYQLINAGEISAVKAGRKTLILVESADAWLARQPAFVSRKAA